MSLLLAILACYLGWTCVAIGQPGGRCAGALRALGVVLGGAALGLCIYRDGAAFGVLLWACLLSAGAYAVVLRRAWRSS